MPSSIQDSIYQSIASIRLIDPHTHINPHAPASDTLADLLGYHYYTELAHSAGMPKRLIEEPGIGPRELVGRLVENLSPIENTAQYRWLIEICRMFFGFEGDRVDASNWESLYDSAERQMSSAEWPQMVLDQSNVEAVFLTNDFDDDLAGFDSDVYIPCLRTDDLVFHLSKPEVQARLAGCTGIELDGSLASLRDSLRQRFVHFVGRGARACAISLPPTFSPAPVSDGRAQTALDNVLGRGPLADQSHKQALSRRVFWTLAELCDEFHLPFDLMIGVNRGVYAEGVFQGQDLYDSRVSLLQYRELFNAFPQVKFPISVLASVTNQELVSHAWIFPNVITNGHWWYSNTPSFIARDAAARLEAVPGTKQIGYYSDAYKLEFVWPKFDMYRHVLAGILADHFVGNCRWSEERAIELGRKVLRDNVDEIFPRPTSPSIPKNEDGTDPSHAADSSIRVDPMAETWTETESQSDLENSQLENGDLENGDPESSDSETSDGQGPSAAGVAAMTAAGLAASAGAAAAQALDFGDDDILLDDSDSADSDDGLDPNKTVPIDTIDEELSANDTVPIETDELLESFGNDDSLADMPTLMESDDTIRIDLTDQGVIEPDEPVDEPVDVVDEQAPESDSENMNFETIMESSFGNDAIADLDPLPTADEIQSIDVADVELTDSSAQGRDKEMQDLAAEIDGAEPLDLDAILGDDDEQTAPAIEMLRGEQSFEADEDSLRVTADPATGELTLPVPDETAVDETTSDETAVDETNGNELGEIEFDDADPIDIDSTIQLDDPSFGFGIEPDQDDTK